MAHKTFISYKYSEATGLRDRIIEAMGDDAVYYQGETSDSPDMSDESNRKIQEYLKSCMYPTSVTIVIISPHMKESHWIDWEISYCLKKITRDGRTSHRNGLVGVIMKVNGRYDVGVGTGNVSLTKKGVAKISTSVGQYITWNVTLNSPNSKDYQQINDPITFTDQITDGLTPTTGVKIVVHFLDGSSVNETIPLDDCYDASTRTFNYTVVPDETVIGGKTVLPECWFVFTYDTSIDSYSQTTYTNTANVKVGSKTFTAPASVKITYDSSKMLTKSGSYNYKNNTYDWTVVFNQEKKAVENPVIVDKLPEGYVPAYDYITVNSTKILLDGTVKDNITALYDETTNTDTHFL